MSVEFDGLAVRRVAQSLRKAGVRTEAALRELIEYRPDLADELLRACGSSGPGIPLQSDLIRLYKTDPIGFFKDVLREYVTPDCEAFLRAVASHDWVAAQSANSVGKTHTMGGLAWWGLLAHESAQVYLVAAGDESNLRRLLWAKVTARLDKRPGLLTCLLGSARYKMTDLKIQRFHGTNAMEQFIEGLIIPQAATDEMKQAKTSGKHAPFLMFLIDEADAVPDAVFHGIETCLSGGTIKLVCSFNPRSRAGYVYERLNKRFKVVPLSALTHPNVITGKDVVPGAVNRMITVRRMYYMSEPVGEEQARRDAACFQVPPYLVNEPVKNEGHRTIGYIEPGFRRATDPMFAPMVLGQFSAVGDANAVFNRQYLSMLFERLKNDPPDCDVMGAGGGLRGDLTIWKPPDPRREYVLTADPAEGLADGDYSVADVWDRLSWEQVAQYRGHPDLGELAGDIASIAAWYNGAEACIERNNHGHAVLLGLTQIHAYDNVYRHDDDGYGYPVSEKARVYLIGQLITEFNLAVKGEGKIKINSLQTLEECINYIRYERTYGAARGFHDDCVSSLRLGYEMLKKGDKPWTTQWQPPPPAAAYNLNRKRRGAGRL